MSTPRLSITDSYHSEQYQLGDSVTLTTASGLFITGTMEVKAYDLERKWISDSIRISEITDPQASQKAHEVLETAASQGLLWAFIFSENGEWFMNLDIMRVPSPQL